MALYNTLRPPWQLQVCQLMCDV